MVALRKLKTTAKCASAAADMNLYEMFDLHTTTVLLLAFTVVAMLSHLFTVHQFVLHCARFRLSRRLTEAEILSETRLLHLRLCRIRNLKPSMDFTTLSACPQFALMLESLKVSDTGCVSFSYTPWMTVSKRRVATAAAPPDLEHL